MNSRNNSTCLNSILRAKAALKALNTNSGVGEKIKVQGGLEEKGKKSLRTVRPRTSTLLPKPLGSGLGYILSGECRPPPFSLLTGREDRHRIFPKKSP